MSLESFSVDKDLVSIIIPKKETSSIMKVMRGKNMLFQSQTHSAVVPFDDSHNRMIFKDSVTEIPEEVSGYKTEKYRVHLTAKDFSLKDLLTQMLPADSVIPSSFETIGHVAHMNLVPELIPYKKLIGEAIILKNPAIRTVAIKTGAINNVYRNMNLEVIAGENNFITEVIQSGFRFKMDFSKVYWNSRLEHEHDSLVRTFPEGSIVADAMCGIGPFAIRAAKLRNCRVLANDLNPDSYVWLCENAKINKVDIECFNMDARAFIKQVFENGGSNFIVMNLPATAIEFLDAIGEHGKKHQNDAIMPIVVFYAFDLRDHDYKSSLKAKADKCMGMHIPDMDIRFVRDVSPGKDMFRCTFNLKEVFGVSEPPV